MTLATDLATIQDAIRPFAEMADALVFTGANSAEGIDIGGDQLFAALMKVRGARDRVAELRRVYKMSVDERHRLIRDGYAAGLSAAEIAEKTGMRVRSVIVTASRLGCTRSPEEVAARRRNAAVPEEQQTLYAELLQLGMSAHMAGQVLALIGGAS